MKKPKTELHVVVGEHFTRVDRVGQTIAVKWRADSRWYVAVAGRRAEEFDDAPAAMRALLHATQTTVTDAGGGREYAEALLQPARVERDQLREWRDKILAALDEADPVKYPEPASAEQRIRALGERARQITDMLAGADERLAHHNANPGKPDTPVEIFAAGTRGIGGTIGVLRDVAAERQRAEAKFPDQHLPDGTGGQAFTIAAGRFRAECQAADAAGTVTWRHVVLEEVYEAIAEPPARPDKLRAELVQVGAMVVRWIEDIDRRAAEQADAA